jgi:hypothetical protein
MSTLGKGFLAIWNDVTAGSEADFHHWHTKEHVPERVGVPGFLRGRRFSAVTGRPAYFTLYETESVDVLASAPYVERLNHPTPWTRRSVAQFINVNRTACRVTASVGAGVGGALATLQLGPRAGGDAGLRPWLVGTALPALAARPGVVGAALGEADLSATLVPTEERKLRSQADKVAAWVVLVDGLDSEEVATACGRVLAPAELARHGAAPETVLAVYRLLFSLAR